MDQVRLTHANDHPPSDLYLHFSFPRTLMACSCMYFPELAAISDAKLGKFIGITINVQHSLEPGLNIKYGDLG